LSTFSAFFFFFEESSFNFLVM